MREGTNSPFYSTFRTLFSPLRTQENLWWPQFLSRFKGPLKLYKRERNGRIDSSFVLLHPHSYRTCRVRSTFHPKYSKLLSPFHGFPRRGGVITLKSNLQGSTVPGIPSERVWNRSIKVEKKKRKFWGGRWYIRSPECFGPDRGSHVRGVVCTERTECPFCQVETLRTSPLPHLHLHLYLHFLHSCLLVLHWI